MVLTEFFTGNSALLNHQTEKLYDFLYTALSLPYLRRYGQSKLHEILTILILFRNILSIKKVSKIRFTNFAHNQISDGICE